MTQKENSENYKYMQLMISIWQWIYTIWNWHT